MKYFKETHVNPASVSSKFCDFLPIFSSDTAWHAFTVLLTFLWTWVYLYPLNPVYLYPSPQRVGPGKGQNTPQRYVLSKMERAYHFLFSLCWSRVKATPGALHCFRCYGHGKWLMYGGFTAEYIEIRSAAPIHSGKQSNLKPNPTSILPAVWCSALFLCLNFIIDNIILVFCNPTPGQIFKYSNLKRYVHTNIHSSTIYDSKDMEEA